MTPALNTLIHAIVAGERSSNRLTAMTAPAYCAAADAMKRASGGVAVRRRVEADGCEDALLTKRN
jgi:hypothetical protein